VKEKKVKTLNTNGQSNIQAGQTTLDSKKSNVNGTNGVEDHDDTVDDNDDDGGASGPNEQLQMEIRRVRTSTESAGLNGEETSEDVEMS
jgi:hypothetical protein